MERLQRIQDQFYVAFIAKDRWKHIVTGLGNTLRVTLFALILGVALGVNFFVEDGLFTEVGQSGPIKVETSLTGKLALYALLVCEVSSDVNQANYDAVLDKGLCKTVEVVTDDAEGSEVSLRGNSVS